MALATKFWTYLELREKVERDLDLEGETFIQPEEMLGYANEALDEAEAEIHTLYEDYFLKRATLTLVVNQDEYSLPSDVFAHKIRRIIYKNGSKVYEVERMRDWKKFENYALARIDSSETEYSYFIINETAGNPKIILSTPSKEAGAFITIWYLRQANSLVADSDIVDIPEAHNFIMQFMKVKCYEKEGHPNLVKAIEDLSFQRSLLHGVLAQMVPDANNEIEADYRMYEEMN